MSNKQSGDHIGDANKKVTAVEWLISQLEKHYVKTDLKNTVAYQQAKAMHKEEIVDAHIEGQRIFDNYRHTQWTTDQAEKYYSETFNTKEK